jgi:hypothetical protein
MSGGYLNLADGAVVKNNRTSAYNGGGIFVEGGECAMNRSPSITGNNAGTGSGGGVFVDSAGWLDMYGGTIGGNKANEGGGVCNLGTFNMTGGVLYGGSTYSYNQPPTTPPMGMENSSVTAHTQSLYGIVKMGSVSFYLGTSPQTGPLTYNNSDYYSDVYGNTIYVGP